MEWNKTTRILIVGLGLIGGSYADGLSAAGYEVGAVDLRQEAIDYALKAGIIRHGRCDTDADYLQQFDLVILSMYPHDVLKWIEENQKHLRPGALITDTIGVKGKIVRSVQAVLRDDLEYVGAHPMAGRERSGVEFADKKIFVGANYIVTPTEKNTASAVAACKQLGETLGFGRISELTVEKHDEMIGFLSQLTHCIAVALMSCRDAKDLAPYSGDSFRDLTRIARINDFLWSELFLWNKEDLLHQMDLFEETFHKLRTYIAEDRREEMRQLMRISTEQRKAFDKSGGMEK